MVDFNQSSIQVFIQHDIKSKNFKSKWVLCVIALPWHVMLNEFGFHSNDGLYDDIFNLFPYFINIDVHLSKPFPQLWKGPFMWVFIFLIIVFFEFFIVLVDCIIRQMHEHICHIFFGWPLIGYSCKSYESFFVNKDS